MLKNVLRMMAILVMCVCVATLCSCANGRYSTSSDPHVYLQYELLEDDTYQVTGFSGRPVKDLVIPATYNDQPVSGIKDDAFKMKKGFWGRDLKLPILSLVIEEGVRNIGNEAFYESGLESVTMADSVEYIGDSAFAYNLTTIQLPEHIVHIGYQAFLSTLLSGELVLGDIDLGESAFRNTSVSTVIFTHGVEHIPDFLFFDCASLTHVSFPDSLKEIGVSAFQDCLLLDEIDFPDTLERIKSSAFKNTGMIELTLKDRWNISDSAFSHNDALTKVTFDGSSIVLEDGVFQDCAHLEIIDFGTLTFIHAKAFIGCPLNDMRVAEDGPYEMVDGALALRYDDGLELILGPDHYDDFASFLIVGRYAFAGRNFASLNVTENVVAIKPYAFYASHIDEAYIQAEVIESYAFNSAEIALLTIASHEIGAMSFYDARRFEEVHIEEGCQKIGTKAFANCFEVEKVYLPASLEWIEQAAFIQCHRLKEVYYGLTEGTPVRLYAGNFIIYQSNITTDDHRINVKIHDDMRIYVHEEVYQACLGLWGDVPLDETYIYSDSLVDFVRIR